MARVEQNVAARMIVHAREKHFESGAVMEIFAGMDLKAEVPAPCVECVQDWFPARGQFVEGCFDQSRRALRPRIHVRPGECAGKRGVRAQAEIRGSFGGKLQLLDSPGLPRARVPFRGLRRESIKRNVIRRMHRDELPLEMGGKLRKRQSMTRQYPADLVAIR